MAKDKDLAARKASSLGSNYALRVGLMTFCATLLMGAVAAGEGGAALVPGQAKVMKELKKAISADPQGFAEAAWTAEDPCAWSGVTCMPFGPEQKVVTKIDWSEKQLGGRLPLAFSKLTNLQALYLQGNAFEGPLPDFRSWNRLKGIYLSENSFTGSLPKSIASLKDLQALNVRSNNIRGSIPKDLSKLTKLKELDLSDNRAISGALPPLERLKDLIWLRASGCAITGTVPAVSRLKQLKVLRLSDNQLDGNLPAFVGSAGGAPAALVELSLSQNRLSGELPISLSQLPALKSLELSNNRLTGSIPTEYGLLTALDWLKLSHNQLSGSIPSELANLASLQALFVDANALFGSIPRELGAMPKLQEISIAGNTALCGGEIRFNQGIYPRAKGTKYGKMCPLPRDEL